MKKHIFRILVFIFSLQLLNSCDDFTEIDLPQNQLTKPIIFEDQNTSNSALNYIYSQIRETSLIGGSNFSATSFLSNYADDIDYKSNNTSDYNHFYNHTVNSNNSFNNSIWKNNYYIIYTINSFIEGINLSKKLPNNYKEQVVSEAITLRAYLYFMLTNLYGDIPYIVTTDYLINQKISKTKSELVYQYIIDDLKKSKILLSEDYPTNLKTRINKYACSALLARVYLYNKQWDLAIIESSEIINSNKYHLEAIEKLFLKESTSTIWHLSPNSIGNNASESSYFIVKNPPVTHAISQNLLNTFELNDRRKDQWISQIGTDYIPFKYQVRDNTGTSLEFTIVIRIEEIYLIRAEAYAQNISMLTKALEDLNTIRYKASLPKILSNNQTQILEYIYKEKQIEFFSEHGHRWFDLKRTNQSNKVLSQVKLNWDITHILLPIPEKELLINPNLIPQNDGY